MREVVAKRFAHEPNLVYGTGNGTVWLLGTMLPDPPSGFVNCSSDPPDGPIQRHAHLASANGKSGAGDSTPLGGPRYVQRNTYLWTASTPEGIASAPRQLAIDALRWDHDPLHNDAVCDTNAAAAVVPVRLTGTAGAAVDSSSTRVVGLWRRCETDHLHTVPHTFTASDGGTGATYSPNVSINVPFMSHAGAEDPMVWTATAASGETVLHALLHDEQVTRCADAPVGCWPGGRHAFSVDGGATWSYSALDTYNGSVQVWLRLRPVVAFYVFLCEFLERAHEKCTVLSLNVHCSPLRHNRAATHARARVHI